MIIKRIFISILSIYIGACLFLYFNQRNILYHPDTKLDQPAQYGFNGAEAIKINTSDNVKITAWYAPAEEGKPTILYLHGNAGNLGRRAGKFNDIASYGIGVLAISYRGYGDSEGQPSENGLYNDARAAITYLGLMGLKPADITLYGESLGTGVAVQMAIEQDFGEIILEAPYDSIGARASVLYPYAPINLLLKDKFNSIDKIKKIHIPLMIIHSKDDNVMPIAHGIKLFEAANQPKIMHVFDNAGHSNFSHDVLAKYILEFSKE